MTFETFLTHEKRSPRKRLTLIISLAAHGVLLALGVAHSFAQVEELSPPSVPLVFMTAPPPPPPLGGGRRDPPKVKTPARPRVAKLTQPDVQPRKETPKEETASQDPHAPPGPGVPDGKIGGQIGGPGKTEVIAPPPVLVPPTVARGQLAIDPQADPYRVNLPPALARSGMQLWALVKVCATRDGQVESVKIVRGADPVLDPIIVQTLQLWRYKPYRVNERPVPFCTMVRYEITAR
jgi:outer membrane biosynthesis protein TonB